MTRSDRAVRAERLRRRIRRPPPHRLLLAFCLLALLALLLVKGYSVRTVGQAGTALATGRAGPLVRGETVLARGTGQTALAALHERPRAVALTFDDGPDPTWTPRIAATLRRLRVPATFFEIGSSVVRHPGLTRALHQEGFELGNHTFTHVQLATLPAWERSLQLDLTETALAGATGLRTRLVRPPYSSVALAVTPPEGATLRALAHDGYVVALSDVDSRDWERPGVARIVAAATAAGVRGGVVLMHDGGGDRAETLAALPRIVRRLRARGLRFTTVSGIVGLPRAAVEQPVGSWERLRGRLLVGTLAVARTLTTIVTILLVPTAALMLLRALVVVALARGHVRRSRPPADGGYAPFVSVLVPAYDEAVGIERAVRSLAASDYPDFEVVVIDDGSTDGTAELAEGLRVERVRVLRQANAGKAAALNRGLTAARGEAVVMVDADTVFAPDTLRRLVAPLADPDVGAVSGNTKVGNRRRLLGRWQHIEYVMGFNLDRRLYDVLRCMPTVPGAIGAFRRAALAEVGGLSRATLAEDTDLTIALNRRGWRVVYAQDAIAWTEAPASLSGLWRQRYRWSYGTLQAVWKHRAALWRRQDGPIGRRGLPYLLLFQVLLPALAPLIDLFALYGLVFLDPLPVAAYWLGFNAVQLALAAYAFRLDREPLRPLWALPLQQFVYRQVMYLVVIESVIAALLGTRLRWQHLERTGDLAEAPRVRTRRP